MINRNSLARGVPVRLAVVALLAALIVTGAVRATPAFAAAPTVASLSPASGSTAGGYPVVITGTGFTGVSTNGVTVGGIGVNVLVNNDTTITIISMPPHTAGPVDIIVSHPTEGTSANTAADDFTYIQAPTVSGLSPTSGLVAGGNLVTITGLGFSGANAVNFGGSIVAPTVMNDTTITVTAPAHLAGTVDVLVVHPTNGTSANTIADNYTYLGVPVVTSLSPTTGPSAGGNNVTITGLSLTGATLVTFGGTATAFVVTGDTSITATAPAHAAGAVDVLVTTAQGTSVNTAADDYTYGDLPVVTSLSPATGPIAGGTVVTITGTGFTGTNSVTFGGTAAAITAVTATTITVTAPAHTAGTVDVLVTTPSGTSANTAADNFIYTSGPTVTSISPKSGPVEGGTLVTITGSGFTGATSVTFGGTSVTPTVASDTSITATSPARAAGTVDVRVVTPLGTSPNTAADDFVYGGGPIITSISPSSGAPGGGNTVTITGTGFTGATSVTFGTTSLTPTVSSDTSISVVAPAGTGTVDIRVVTPVGTSPNTAADNYTYGSTTRTFTLYFRWTLLVWTGANGASVASALSGQETPPNPATNDVSGIVTAIFKYNNAQQRFEGYFPGSANVPGANDFTTFMQGEAYWFAINSSSGASWTVLAN